LGVTDGSYLFTRVNSHYDYTSEDGDDTYYQEDFEEGEGGVMGFRFGHGGIITYMP
jgi:hypothetical protein